MFNCIYICSFCASDTKSAKLVAQKSKGMPRISFSLTKLTGSAAPDAMASLSLELFKAYKGVQSLFMKGPLLFAHSRNCFSLYYLYKQIYSISLCCYLES